jgi:hypothetical protein
MLRFDIPKQILAKKPYPGKSLKCLHYHAGQRSAEPQPPGTERGETETVEDEEAQPVRRRKDKTMLMGFA